MAEISVTGPDGSTFAFPEGTPGDVITGAMRSHYGVQAPAQSPPDQYQAAAAKEVAGMKAAGVPTDYGLARRAMQGATFGAGDEIMAGLDTPLQMISHRTINPVEGYKYAKALEDQRMADARQKQGALGTVAEIAGGLGSAGSIGKAGFTLARDGMGLAGRSAALAGEGAGYGGVQGFLDGGNSLDERLSGAAKGAGTGAVVGAALPAVTGAAGAVAAPLLSNIRARINPQGVGLSQVTRALGDTGRPVNDIVGDVQQAASEGQPMYTLADAMGVSGQRLLRTGMAAPGPGRVAGTEFLEQRQAGQARRLANTLTEGFDSPGTADQTQLALTKMRDKAADVAYGNARQNAGAVDVTPAINAIDATVAPGVNKIASPGSGIADDSIESVLNKFRARLTDGKSNLTDYAAVERVRGDIKDAADSAFKAGQGNRARLLGGIVRQLDASMENASTGFKAANQQFSRGSKAIEAVDAGKNAAMRGRTEDTVPAFRAMTPVQQGAFRAGYVDPLVADVQKAPIGANKARPFTSDAFQAEAHAMAPLATGNQMLRRVGRENTMFQTRAEAMGGSKTDYGLAEQQAAGVDPGMLVDVAHAGHGSPTAIARLFSRVTDSLNGYTPAVREAMVKTLLQRGANPQVTNQLQQSFATMQRNRAIAQSLLRGATVGTALLPQRTTTR